MRRDALLLALACALPACSGPSQLKTKQDADFMILTPAYAVERNLGKGPVEVDSDDTLTRFQLYRRGLSPQYALLLYPEKVDGVIELDLGDDAQTTAQSDLGRYYDLVLRAHRLLLRADVASAHRLLDRIEGEFDVSYPTLVLRADLALLEGDATAAESLMRDARALQPERKDIDDAWLAAPAAAGGKTP